MIIEKKHYQTILSNNAEQSSLPNKTIFSNIFNNGQGNIKYFSSIDAEIYFEDLYIDDVVSINFSLQQNTLPLFGYNSYVYDDISLGSRMVQGTFTINFTKANYLQEVLNTLKQISIEAADANIYTMSDSSLSEYDEQNQTQILNNDRPYNKKPLWDKRFDIYVSYGNAKQPIPGPASTMQIIEGVQLVSCTQQLDSTGSPVLETYQFIARDLKDMQIKTQTQVEFENNQHQENNPIHIESLTYEEVKSKEYVETDGNFIDGQYKYYTTINNKVYMHNEKIIGMFKIDIDSEHEITNISIEPEIVISGYKNKWSKVYLNIPLDEKAIKITDALRKDIKEVHETGIDLIVNIKIDYINNGSEVSYETVEICKITNVVNSI